LNRSDTQSVTSEGHSDQLRADALHVAIIMDGNGRWAKQRHLPRALGHRAGVEALRRVVKSAPKMGINHLTVYAFSTENWRRPLTEVQDLMGLLRAFIKSDLKTLHENGVRVKILGFLDSLSSEILGSIQEAEALTKDNQEFNLNVALNYGSQQDITRVVKFLAQKVEKSEISVDDIDQDTITRSLMTSDLPPVDLLIRTSGESRLSNFLLWELAYAEILIQDVLWPDYDDTHLSQALESFAQRERRFGGLNAQSFRWPA